MQTFRWQAIKWHELPKEIVDLCEYCRRFEVELDRMIKMLPFIDSNTFLDAHSLAMQVLSSYMRFIKTQIGEEQSKSIMDDIHKTVSIFFDRDGKFKVPYGEFYEAQRNSQLNIFVPSYFGPFMVFINSRIYDPLASVVSRQRIGYDFAYESLNVAGILPEIKMKEEKGLIDKDTGKEVSEAELEG